MTVPYGLDAFENARLLTLPRQPSFDRSKLVSIAITVAVHAAILGAALTAVHVSHTKVMQELSVQITPQKLEPPKDDVIAPPPQLTQPTMVSVPPPEVSIAQPISPIQVQQAKPAPAPPVAAMRSPVAGEGRDAFLGRLLGQLNRFKQYPRSARQAHIEGVVQLHFVMDAEGKVLSFEIAKSSGRPILDAEALALIQRAQPLPALPADYPTRTLDAIVPIEFYLNR
ncbi:MAG TPA: energy transducer TonB [Rhizomicrobium sp.]|nr:energy transducer TonB [Rhizomicrobium sp.]